ncbi:hypothetical protein OIV83_004206 [Microbotryomycetes sp. JL201]|nr:hypothetical protein OIV83_004206 [Microbotryomycetes sp. JL201]
MPGGSSPTSPTSPVSNRVKLAPLVMSSTATQPATAPRTGRHLHKRTLSTSTRIFFGSPTTPPSRKIRHGAYHAVEPDSPSSINEGGNDDAQDSRRNSFSPRKPHHARAVHAQSRSSDKRATSCGRVTVWIVVGVCGLVAIFQLVLHRTNMKTYATTTWQDWSRYQQSHWTDGLLAPLNESRPALATTLEVASMMMTAEMSASTPNDMAPSHAITLDNAAPRPSVTVSVDKEQPKRLPSEPQPAVADAPQADPTTTTMELTHAPQKFLFVTWMGEQETKAQSHLYQLGLLALALNRTLVLPQVHQSRFGACYHNDFSLYYEQDTLERFGIPYMSHQDFLEWALAGKPKSGQLLALARGKRVPDDVAFMPLKSLCVDKVPVDLSVYAPRAFFLPTTSWKADHLRLAFGKNVVADLLAEAKSDDDGGANVLVVQYDLRYPFLTPTLAIEFNPAASAPTPYSYFEYSSFWTKLGQEYAQHLSPYIAVHWRTETLPVEALATCGSALVDKLVTIKRTRPEIKMVYLATDYPLEGLGRDGSGKGAAVAHSGTMSKSLTNDHHDAMRTFLKQFQETFDGSSDETTLEWTSFVELQKQIPLSDELSALLPMIESKHRQLSLQELDHAIVGIVDKVVLTQAELFIAGQFDTTTDFTRRCAKHSQFTEQVVTGRQQFLERFAANDETTKLHSSGSDQDTVEDVGADSPLWNIVGHFAMDQQDDD